MAMAQKADEKLQENKKATLHKMKLLGKVWTGFFADSTFSTAAYRALFIDLTLSEIDAKDVDRDHLEVMIPEKDRRTKEKRVEELEAAGYVASVDRKGPDGEKRPIFTLGKGLREHLDLYCEYFSGEIAETDSRILALLAKS